MTEGGFPRQWGGLGDDLDRLRHPVSLAADADGDIYAADVATARVVRYRVMQAVSR